MFQKRVLVIIATVLSGLIGIDLLRIYTVNNDFESKILYLELSKREGIYFNIYDEFLKLFRERQYKKSIKEGYDHFLNLDPATLNFEEEINWKRYIDVEDHSDFSELIAKIPGSNSKFNNIELGKIRNKNIYESLIKYAIRKIGGIGIIDDRPILMKDIFNNISITTLQMDLEGKSLINGYSLKPVLTIPKTDKIKIVTNIPLDNYALNYDSKDSVTYINTFDVTPFIY